MSVRNLFCEVVQFCRKRQSILFLSSQSAISLHQKDKHYKTILMDQSSLSVFQQGAHPHCHSKLFLDVRNQTMSTSKPHPAADPKNSAKWLKASVPLFNLQEQERIQRFGREGPRNMKSMQPPLTAIFYDL